MVDPTCRMKRLVAILMFVCCSLQAANWYLDSAATGAGNGTSWGDAWTGPSNVVWGASGVTAGDTLWISGGTTTRTYAGQLTIGASGTSGSSILIKPGTDSGHTGIAIFTGTYTFTEGVNPPASDITRHGIYGESQSFVTIDGGADRRLLAKDCNTGFYLVGGQSNVIRYISVTNSYVGVRMQVATNSVIEFCDVRRLHGGGVHIAGYGQTTGANAIRNNYIETRFYDGIGVSSGVDVSGNWVRKSDNEEWTTPTHYSHPDGIVAISSNNRIWNNRVDGFEQNIYIDALNDAPADMTNIVVYGNLVTTNAPDPTTNNMYGIVVQAESRNIDGVKLFNNTIPRHDIRAGGTAGMTLANLWVSNNIARSGYGNVNTGIVQNATWKSDNNCFFALSSWYEGIGGIYSLADWQAKAGKDASSINGDPAFTAITTWTLQAGSPCIDAGANLGTDYQTALTGTTWPNPTTATRTGLWDIGAYEYTGSGGAKVTTPGKLTIIGKVTF